MIRKTYGIRLRAQCRTRRCETFQEIRGLLKSVRSARSDVFRDLFMTVVLAPRYVDFLISDQKRGGVSCKKELEEIISIRLELASFCAVSAFRCCGFLFFLPLFFPFKGWPPRNPRSPRNLRFLFFFAQPNENTCQIISNLFR